MKNKYLYIFIFLNLFKEVKSLSKKNFTYPYYKGIRLSIAATSFFLFLKWYTIPKIKFYKNNKKFKKAKDLYRNLNSKKKLDLNNKNELDLNNKNELDFDSLYQIINTINPQFISSEFHGEYKNIKKCLILSNLLELKLDKITEEEIKFFLTVYNVENLKAEELLKKFKSINHLLYNIKESINFIQNDTCYLKNKEKLIIETFKEDLKKLTKTEEDKNTTDILNTNYSSLFKILEEELEKLNEEILLKKTAFIENLSFLFTEFTNDLFQIKNDSDNPDFVWISNFLEKINEEVNPENQKNLFLENKENFENLIININSLKENYIKILKIVNI